MKKSTTTAILIIVLIAVALFGFQYAMHTKGNQCVQAGAYEDAATYYAKDRIFSKGLSEEAMAMAGLEYLNQGNYEKSIEILEAHRTGLEDALCQAYCGLARDMITDTPEEALTILNNQNPTANTQELVDTVRMEIARQYLSNLQYDEVLQAVETISDASFSGLQELKSEAYFYKAMLIVQDLLERWDRSLDSTKADCEEILQLLENCVGDSRAEDFTDVLAPLVEGNFEEAAKAVPTLVKDYPSICETSQWLTVFRDLMPDTAYTDWKDQLVNQQRIFSLIGDQDTAFPSWTMNLVISMQVDKTGTACYDVFDSDLEILPYVEPKDLPKTLGSNPNGKVLIVRDYWGEADGVSAASSLKQKRLAVYGELMNYLPSELYPSSMEEIEYVIVISYDYNITGTYSGVGRIISGYQETGTVTVYAAPSGKVIYKSPVQKGPKLGNSVTMGKNDRVLSGGRPMLGEYVQKAMETVASRIN